MSTPTDRPQCVCGNTASGRGDYPWLCWSCLPDSQDSYPVIVEYTYRHVVWVPAEDQADAVRQMQADGYEYTDDARTLMHADWEVHGPKSAWDWDDISRRSYDHPYEGTEADAHVKTHRAHLAELQRAAKRAACVEAGHPDTEPPLSDGRRWCPGCFGYLPAVATVQVGGESR